jgi:hypothetical protein
MDTYLDVLILEHHAALVDAITKDAVRQIRAYERAPLQQTLSRVGRWLTTLRTSIRQNDPRVLEGFLMGVADERRKEGYALDELHAIVRITEGHLRELIHGAIDDPVEQNGLLALLEAVMGAARMMISVNFFMMVSRGHLDQQGGGPAGPDA